MFCIICGVLKVSFCVFQHEFQWMGSHVVHWNKCCYQVLYGHSIEAFEVFSLADIFNFFFFFFSVRVSNELGMGRPLATKYSVYTTVFQSLLIGIFFSVVVLITKDYFAVIFTSSEEVQRAVSHLAYLLGVTMILNSVQPVISGKPTSQT